MKEVIGDYLLTITLQYGLIREREVKELPPLPPPSTPSVPTCPICGSEAKWIGEENEKENRFWSNAGTADCWYVNVGIQRSTT